MTARPWYRRFPDNFIGGTVGLTLEEKGAYSLLLDLMYVRGGPIPDEPRYIAGVCNCSVRKWNAIRLRLLMLGKVEVRDGFLTNHRAQEEMRKASESAQERAESGAKGGNKSAQIRDVKSKNNGLDQANLKHTRASQLLNSVSKEGATLLDPTERTVRLDRRLEPELFARCAALVDEKVPAFIEHKSFPVHIVAKAQAVTTGDPDGETFAA